MAEKLSRTLIIAEAGVNHNGSLQSALELVDAAAAAGADIVKFQTFRSEEVIAQSAPKARYQLETTGDEQSQLEMVRALELDEHAHLQISDRCNERGVEFMSTPFDVPSVALLMRLGVRRLKVPSGEINNPLLLRAVSATGLPVIMSSGMCTLGDIERGLALLASGMPGSRSWQSALAGRISLLHCTTEYPAPPAEVNLRAIRTMATAFDVPVGYSDHTEGIAVSIAAVSLGAVIIEKHFTLDRNLPGPDHRASLEPRELEAMVRGIRTVELALGSSVKAPTASELANLAIARRSLVARVAIRQGTLFSTDNLALKRPGTGVPAHRLDEWIGKPATKDYEPDELIAP